MANTNGKSYAPVTHRSKAYVVVPTAATRRAGMFWKKSGNKGGAWVYGKPRKYARPQVLYNPRQLPVTSTLADFMLDWDTYHQPD